MIWLAKLVSRPFDRVLALSFHILWFELDLLAERFHALLPSLSGQFGSVRHYGRMAVEAFFIAEAFQWLTTAAVLSSFWLFYAFCLPPTGVSYPFVIDWSADVFSSSSVGLKLQDGLHGVACKDVPMQPIPAHVSALELNLHSEMTSCDAGFYKLQLLNANHSDVFTGVWQPLLPVSTWSPLVALGLAERKRLAPLLRQPLELVEEMRQSVSAARICLQPPLRSLDISLQVLYKLRGFYRFVQHWPLLWSSILVVATGFATWSVVCLLLVVLVLRRSRLPPASAASAATAVLFPALSGTDAAEPEPNSEVDRFAKVTTVVSDVWKQSVNKVEEAGTQVVQAAMDPDLQVTAASAVSGALALGAGGGCAGLVTGSVAGGACGLVPAIFTFGLSIPVGVVLGGGAGAAAGTALGSGAGAVLGTFLGRRWVQNRPAMAESPKDL